MYQLQSARIAMLVGGVLASFASAAEPPLIIPHENWQNVLRLPDGELWRVAGRFNAIYHSRSLDNGLTWEGAFNDTWKLTDFPGGTNPIPAVEPNGAIHFFKLKLDGSSQLDLYEVRSDPTRTTWDTDTLIHDGRIGSVNQAIRTSSGRLVVGYNDRAIAPPSGHGNFMTRVSYRDPGDADWTLSPSQLISPVPSGWNGSPDGAVEPSMIELNDGRLWSLMRSQTGKLRESFSSDQGATWTPTVDSNFHTTTGPTNLTRLDDGRMVLLWNNGTMPQRYTNKIWYAGRDALHAAISDDDGATWKGFREVLLDANRNLNPTSGDSGTAYPFATATNDNHLVVVAGQASARAMFRLDPDWLLETDRADDFTAANALDNWSVFKSYGDVGDPAPVKRRREQGAVLIDDPDVERTKTVLHVRRPNMHDGDGAVWNLPMTERGRTTVRLKLQEAFAGGSIAMTDRFFAPTDPQDASETFYKIDIASDGGLTGGGTLDAGQWHDVTLEWKVSERQAIVRVDGEQVGVVSAQAGVDVWPGLSYLRLRSTAPTVDTAGYLVDRVAHDGSRIGDTERMTATQASAAMGGADEWTHVRFDEYVSNGNVSETNPSGNGAMGSFAGPFLGFVDPATGAPPVGIVLESSTSVVTFTDATSAQVTSDLLGPKTDETLTLRFVDPQNPSQAATVSEVAWRFGSTLSDNVIVQLFDLEGNEMPDWLFAAMDGGISGTTGYKGLEDLHYASAIHEIRFTALGTDTWVLGSFNQGTDLADFSIRGFQVVPEPHSVLLMAACVAWPAMVRPGGVRGRVRGVA